MMQWKFVLLVVTMLMMSPTAPASAHGSHGGGGGPDGPWGILQELILPCRAACSETARGCFDDANPTASSCIASACSAKVTAAQAACKGGRSTSCRTAVRALYECGASCLDTRAAAADVCRSNRNKCVAACDTAG